MTWGLVCSANTEMPEALHRHAEHRAAALIGYARQNSPLYARLYRNLPPDAALTDLPPITRGQLMAQFDDWATDRAITRASVDEFLAGRDNLSEDYLGRYAVWTSSGTCSQWGIFVQPHDALAVYDAELATRSLPGQGTASQAPSATRLPAVLIAAIDGHYAGIVTWRRMQRATPWLASQMRALSVAEPLEKLVAQLNTIQPRFVAAYPSVLQCLADEQVQGRLDIAPTLLWSGGEALSPVARQHIVSTFNCSLMNDYGASECMSLAFECPHGRMHLNADWVVLQAVDKHGRPVPPGRPSHTSLLTNLANPIQPLIRYDLGDSITEYVDPCPCGCLRPSFSVSGRADDVLHLPRGDGTYATVFPLAVQSALEEGAGITLFQVVQTQPDQLLLRVGACHGADHTAARKALAVLRKFLVHHGAGKTKVELDTAAPCVECSGKVRQVVALSGHRG